MKKKAKKKPQDATLRNVRAAKKRSDTLKERIEKLEARVEALEKKKRGRG